ncbi:MAG: clavaldehyde dehydrogenase [uncultured Nocardioidaceae bacterium]|uniref:Clavaldehyde dehydrogenase n=1 Tax=uncultured Nocardioidaceae bacterium TaxID=253824 RepID=A0A6J4M6M7_9ACTN|nr:MAG: clavaldehyde dehydrogenase [uncultured Nocardioidaceae bacterium]
MLHDSALSGTTALVTGASSGIGEATARHLAALGADVALVARRHDRIETLAKEIDGTGRRTAVIEADVTDRAQAEDAVQRTVDQLGRLDILINNAGVMLLGPIADAPVEEWEQMVQVNVLGLLYCAKASLPHLLEAAESAGRGTSDLVNVSSVAGRQVRLGSGVYNATKHAVGAFSESLRQEVTRRHVRVGLIEPGAVATELTDHNRPEIKESIKARFADMERLVADDIADAVGYMVTRPRHVAINELLVRPTEQEQ